MQKAQGTLETLAEQAPRGVPRDSTPVEARKFVPVKWWAVLGAGFIAVMVYLMTAWILSDDFATTPTGPDPVPGYMKLSAILVQIICPALLIGLLIKYVVLPLKRERTIPFDGVLLLALITLIWQDVLLGYTASWGSYNAYLINFGSWGPQIPGWVQPNGENIAEPVFFMAAYPALVLPLGMACCWVMRKTKERWPRTGTVGVIAAGLGTGMVLDFVFEMPFAFTGLYNFGGIPGPRLFADHYYVFPLVEVLIMGSLLAGVGALRYFRDDKGNSVVERGIDTLKTSGARKTVVRVLAIAGFVNVLYLVGFNLPFQWLTTHSAAWPEDTTSRSYFRSELCGEGTGYHCSGPTVPIPRPDSAHVDEDGQLVPAG